MIKTKSETICKLFFKILKVDLTRCSGRVCDLLRAEPDQHEHGEVLRHRVPPQVPLSVHCVAGNNKQDKVFRLRLYQS